jgi:hypothetical protein
MKIGTSISITNTSMRTGQKVSLLSTDTNVPTDARSIDYEYLKVNGDDFLTSNNLRFVVKES